MYTLLYIKYITIKDPLYSTGNSTQYSVVTYMGKEAAAAAAKSLQSCLALCDLWTVAHQAPLSIGFSRQEHWNGLPFPSPGKEARKE